MERRNIGAIGRSNGILGSWGNMSVNRARLLLSMAYHTLIHLRHVHVAVDFDAVWGILWVMFTETLTGQQSGYRH